MNSRYLLDSWALLALLYEEKPAAGRIEQLLHEAADGQARLFLCVLNLGETFYIFGHRHGLEAAKKMVSNVKQLPLHILSVDEPRVLAAARYKTLYPIAYADAFAAAAADERGAILVTGDPELLALAEELQLEALPRESKTR